MKRKIAKNLVLFSVILAVLALCSCSLLFEDPLDISCEHQWAKASCSTPATCTLCGETQGSVRSHSYITNIVSPTCTDGGYTLYTCKYCAYTDKDNFKDSIGHTESNWIFDSEPTADLSGFKHTECVNCGKIIKSEEIPPHMHEIVSVEYKAPTCTVEGNEAYKYCILCGYNTYVAIAPTGHSYDEWTSLGNGTHCRICQNDGTHIEIAPCSGDTEISGGSYICDVCGGHFDFGARLGNSTYGYYALGKYSKGAKMQKFYRALQKTAESFVTNNDDILGDNGYYILEEYKCTDYGITLDEAVGVWKIFYIENPAYYWLSTMSVTRGDDTLVLVIDEEYANASVRRECDAAIETMVAKCALLIEESMSDLERAMAIAGYIISSIEYAYEDDGVTPEGDIWAHNIVGLACYDFGVCETYAKSFLYLCLINDVDCIIVTGIGGGETHAWNYFEYNGVWYGADITWSDHLGEELCYDSFGLSDEDIHAEHTLHSSTSFGIDFIYPIPEISDEGMELCELSKNGERVGVYTDIDAAFSAMSDPTAEYSVYIGFYSFYVGAVAHTIDSATTPDVKKLTIIGNNEIVGEGYLDNNSVIYIDYMITLMSEVEFVNLDIKGSGSIHLIGDRLILSGNSDYIRILVSGLSSGSEIVSNNASGSYFFEGIDVYKLTILDGSCAVFGKNSHIVYCYDDELYTTSASVRINIDHRV